MTGTIRDLAGEQGIGIVPTGHRIGRIMPGSGLVMALDPDDTIVEGARSNPWWRIGGAAFGDSDRT